MQKPSRTSSLITKLKGLIGLKTQLMLAFCTLAVLPALVVMAVLIQASERNLGQTVVSVTNLASSSIEDSSNRIADSTLNTLTKTSDRLISLSETSINQTSNTLIGISQDKLEGSTQDIIGLSRESNEQVSRGMVTLNKEASEKLSSELIDLSRSANQDLARTTSQIAERAVQQNAERLIQINERLSDELSSYLATTNEQAATEVSTRLLAELEREPLVNFKLLAQIMAQTFAGGKITDRKEAYITIVNRKGDVLASTRYKKKATLKHLDIVKRALQDPPEVAAGMPLITYQDGSDSYLGVYARRPDGGAVIVSYNRSKAQDDLDVLGNMVNGSFENLVTITTSGTRKAFETSTPRIKAETTQLSQEAIRTIKGESERLSQQSAEKMSQRATQISRSYADDMTLQANNLATEAAGRMQSNARAIAERALAEMAPIGKRSASQAVETMTPQAQQAVDEIKDQLTPQIQAASLEATKKMLPEAEAALERSRQTTLVVGLGILMAAVALGLGASWALSKRIADPIEVEKQLRQAELHRMGQEMEIATRIQTALLPTDLDISNYDLAMELQTATEVGGDLIDYLPQPDGRFWLAVGDVTGHGLTPGLVMMMAQSMLSSLVAENPEASPREHLVRLNQVLHQNVKYRLGNDNYMTLQLIHHAGDGQFVAAGMHLDLLIYRAQTRSVERVEVPGFWTGLLPDVSDLTTDHAFQLGPEDVLLLYSDGLIEAMNQNGEQFDMHRLEETLRRIGEHSAESIKVHILAEIRSWIHEQLDDISLIVLKRHPQTSGVRAVLNVPAQ